LQRDKPLLERTQVRLQSTPVMLRIQQKGLRHRPGWAVSLFTHFFLARDL
jgi:hypothetical protein